MTGSFGNNIGDLVRCELARIELAPAVNNESDGADRTLTGLGCESSCGRSWWLYHQLAAEECVETCLRLLCWDSEDLTSALATSVERHHKPG